jgi:ABC-type glycerol-3-phosphate transport system substrate-binding protein
MTISKKAFLRAPRLAVAGLGLIAALGVVSPIGREEGAAAQSFQPGTYRLLSFFPQDNYDKWLRGEIDRFEASHAGVKFEIQYTDPTNIIQMIKTGVASGQAPDVATQLPGAAQLQLFQAGQILDFKPYINADPEWQGWIKGWDKVPASQYSTGEHIFAANVSLGPMLLWYWKDMLATAGHDSMPTDIDGLFELAGALQAKGLPTMGLGLNSQALFNYDYTFYTLEANFDPDGSKARMADEGKYPWTSPEFKQAADLFRRLYDAGVFYEGAIEKNYDPDTKVDFGARKASIAWPFGPWMDGYYPDDTVGNIGIALFPRLDAAGPAVLTSSNDLEFTIPIVSDAQKDQAHIDTMVAFVKQLNSPESQDSLWENGIFPIMADIIKDKKAEPGTWASVLKVQIEMAAATKYAVDENTYSPNTDSALTNGLQAVLLGQKTVDEMLAEVQAANQMDHPCSPDCK